MESFVIIGKARQVFSLIELKARVEARNQYLARKADEAKAAEAEERRLINNSEKGKE